MMFYVIKYYLLTRTYGETSVESRTILVNALVRQLFAYIRRVVNNGSAVFGIPPLDPLKWEHFHLYVPAGLVNLDLILDKIFASGIGGFEVHRSHLDLTELSFDLDISVPRIDISAEQYGVLGDFFTAVPMYGQGSALFRVNGFRFQAKLFLKQSDDEQSVLIERIENASFVIPSFKSELTGAIGGDDIDNMVNSMLEEVIIDYVNRFQSSIALAASSILVILINPILGQIDTWRFIAPLLPPP